MAQIAQIHIEQPPVMTVFDIAGEMAIAPIALAIQENPGIISDQQAHILIAEVRRKAIESRIQTRQEGRDNQNSSVAPGVRTVLTPEGYDRASQSAQSSGFNMEGVAEWVCGLATVTLGAGCYKARGNGFSFFATAGLDAKGRIEHLPQRSFWVHKPGVVGIIGTTALERWLNPDLKIVQVPDLLQVTPQYPSVAIEQPRAA